MRRVRVIYLSNWSFWNRCAWTLWEAIRHPMTTSVLIRRDEI